MAASEPRGQDERPTTAGLACTTYGCATTIPAVDLQAVRAFVAVAETSQFQAAGARLGISQQAVSKRIAVLERELGVRLFARTSRGAFPTTDGQALLPRARGLLQAEARALAAVRAERRPLRVDVISMRVGPALLVREFHDTHPQIPLEVLTIFDAATAIEAVEAGRIDATFRAAPLPGMPLPHGVAAERALDEPLLLMIGPHHPLAARDSITPAELSAHTIWMPGVVAGTEWAVYYSEMTRALGVRIDTAGPNFGSEEMVRAVAASATLATLAGAQTLPSGGLGGLKLIELVDPTPVYPHSLVWHTENPQPALVEFRRHVAVGVTPPAGDVWSPPAHR